VPSSPSTNPAVLHRGENLPIEQRPSSFLPSPFPSSIVALRRAATLLCVLFLLLVFLFFVWLLPRELEMVLFLLSPSSLPSYGRQEMTRQRKLTLPTPPFFKSAPFFRPKTRVKISKISLFSFSPSRDNESGGRQSLLFLLSIPLGAGIHELDATLRRLSFLLTGFFPPPLAVSAFPGGFFPPTPHPSPDEDRSTAGSRSSVLFLPFFNRSMPGEICMALPFPLVRWLRVLYSASFEGSSVMVLFFPKCLPPDIWRQERGLFFSSFGLR